MAEAEDQGSSISADFVKLVSNDEHEFILKRSHALTSGTIKAMLSNPTIFKNKEMSKVRKFSWPCCALCNQMTHATSTEAGGQVLGI